MEEQYFVIAAREGDVFFVPMNRSRLEYAMESDNKLSFRSRLGDYTVLGQDLGAKELLVIKGHIVVPEPVEVVSMRTVYRLKKERHEDT